VTPLLLLALLQGEPPTVHATVDRNRVAVGDEVVYTVETTSRSLDPIELSVAPFTGFQVVSRIERTEMSSIGQATRTTIIETHLRAARVGQWQLGPARARQGRYTAEARAIAVQVDAGRSGNGAVSVMLNARVRRLLERAPPPRRGQPAVVLIVSDNTVRVGQQVDVVTAAWFPRDLRVQLSNPPTLHPPVIDGVWTYPQSAPAAVAATRTIGGVVYDLFVSPQIVFPLVPGTVTIPAAALRYSAPGVLSLLGQVERVAVTSAPETLLVQPLPAAGRPADFSGAVGTGLKLERRMASGAATAGQAVTVEYVLSGEGNTALWPAPEVHWPASARAYTERVEEKVAMTDGRLGGSKIFRYLVVPDSLGVLHIPEVRYAYFDLASDRYAEVAAGAAAISVTPADEVAATAALPPALLAPGPPAWSWRLAHDVPVAAWLLLLLLPPLAIVVYDRLPRRRPRAAVVPASDSLAVAEQRLDHAVDAVVPDPTLRAGRGLGPALRAAGLDAAVVAEVLQVRERLLASRYAPWRESDPRLIADVDALTQRLAQSRHRWRGELAVMVLLFAALGLGIARPTMLVAQAPSPEQLYETGSLSAAVRGFESRTVAEPAVAAHWYGLGASYYRLGLKSNAAAAWVRAERLDPRANTIRRALRLVPPSDPISARWLWVPPLRPEELLLAGLVGWMIGWFGWVGRPRVRDRWAVLLVFSAIAVLSGVALRYWYQRPVALVVDGATLRLSPYGRAPEIAKLDAGSAVLELQSRADWVLVRTPDDREGWLTVASVASVSR